MAGYGKTMLFLLSLLVLTACAPDRESGNVNQGFSGNRIRSGLYGATISGGGQTGFPNQVSGLLGTISGGEANLAGELATIGGGSHNSAVFFRATVGGGAFNQALVTDATIGGGTNNTASGARATIAGGAFNLASDLDTAICGGAGNAATFRHAAVCGGTANTASSLDSVVTGGSNNTASGTYSSVSGGKNNLAEGFGASVGGGTGNQSTGRNGTVAGGFAGSVVDDYGTVSGGQGNMAGSLNGDPHDDRYAVVGGGLDNRAGGLASVVPGGSGNLADGDYSFASGYQAQVNPDHPGAFLFADASGFPFLSLAANEFAVRAAGGIRFVSGIDEDGNPAAGVYLPPGSGSWETLSDRNAKTTAVPVESLRVLDSLMAIPISTWQYTSQPGGVRHMGPMAQDFHAAFGLGGDARTISTVDADGVALAAIQGLYTLTQDQQNLINAQQERIAALEARLESIEHRSAGNSGASPASGWTVFAGFALVALAIWKRNS